MRWTVGCAGSAMAISGAGALGATVSPVTLGVAETASVGGPTMPSLSTVLTW